MIAVEGGRPNAPKPSTESRPLRSQLMSATVGPMLIGLVALGAMISVATLTRLEREAGNALASKAHYFAELLDMTVGRQLMDLQSRAALLPQLGLQEKPIKLAQWLTTIQDSIPEYAWIGYANTQGLIVASGNHVLEGYSVAERDWYRQGQHQAKSIDLHDAKLLTALLPERDDGQPWRFIDVTAPVRRPDGLLLGVLGAHLSWDWLIAQQQRFTASLRLPHRVDVIVTSADGSPRLMGPGLDASGARRLTSHQRAVYGESGWVRETWPDGQTYLVGFTKNPGFGDGHQLDWITLIRAPLREAVPLSHRSVLSIWMVVVGAALLFLFATRLLLNRSLTPIERLMRDIGQIARDGGRVQWNRHTPQEFILLAQATNQLITAMEAHQLADRAKSQFLADMSHEIRTPLHGLIGHAELLKLQMGSAAHQDDLDRIILCAKDLTDLLNDILDLSAIEEQRIVLDCQPFDLDEMIDANATIFRVLAERKSLDVQLHKRGIQHAMVVGDRRRLGQIFRNMLSNAVKFTDEGGVAISVRLDCSEPASEQTATDAPVGAWLTIDVRDTGIGLTQAQQDIIFGRFQQANSDTALRYGGSGLGLPVSRALAQAMGGRLELQSSAGQGTCISVTVPVTIGHPATPTIDSAGIAVTDQRPLNILVVDDVTINRQLLIRWCHVMGHHTSEAGTAADALSMADAQDFDLILLDVDLPDGNGRDVARILRTRTSVPTSTVILAISGHAFDHDVIASRRAGCDDHLVKPIHWDHLAKWIAAVYQTKSIGPGEKPVGPGSTQGSHWQDPNPESP